MLGLLTVQVDWRTSAFAPASDDVFGNLEFQQFICSLFLPGSFVPLRDSRGYRESSGAHGQLYFLASCKLFGGNHTLQQFPPTEAMASRAPPKRVALAINQFFKTALGRIQSQLRGIFRSSHITFLRFEWNTISSSGSKPSSHCQARLIMRLQAVDQRRCRRDGQVPWQMTHYSLMCRF